MSQRTTSEADKALINLAKNPWRCLRKSSRSGPRPTIALKEIEALMSSRPGTPEGDRLDVLATLVEAWEQKRYPLASAKIRYTAEPLGKLKVTPDFLPAPKDLLFREEGIKVTLALSKRSVEFFKREAAKHNTLYQRMIRRLLDAYAEHHESPQTSRGTRTRRRRAA